MCAIGRSPRGRRQLGKLRDRELRVRIVEAVGRLSGFPAVAGLEALKGHRYGYRLRIGDHRALIDVDTDRRIVLVQEIRRRNERTY